MNPFEVKGSSFGSWGANSPEPAQSPVMSDSDGRVRVNSGTGSDLGLRQNGGCHSTDRNSTVKAK